MSWRNRSPKTLAHRWPLNGHYADLIRGQDGTPVNGPTWAQTLWGPQCVDLTGGTQHVNLGDVAALNAVSAFTLAFWMNQNTVPSTGTIFYKPDDANHYVRIHTVVGNLMYFNIRDGGATYAQINYPTVISASHWHHIAMVFDGSGAANIDRLKVYLDGSPLTLVFTGTIPALTADLSGQDTYIGFTNGSFLGKLFDFRLLYATLTRDEVNSIMRGHG